MAHPPEAAGERYVALAGGADALLAHARHAFERGDFRWVAEVVNHLVFAEPDNREAKQLQALALEQLGYGAENGTWRNFFLMGAHELRHGPSGTAAAIPPDFIANLSNGQLFEALAIQIDGPRAGDQQVTLRDTRRPVAEGRAAASPDVVPGRRSYSRTPPVPGQAER